MHMRNLRKMWFCEGGIKKGQKFYECTAMPNVYPSFFETVDDVLTQNQEIICGHSMYTGSPLVTGVYSIPGH